MKAQFESLARKEVEKSHLQKQCGESGGHIPGGKDGPFYYGAEKKKGFERRCIYCDLVFVEFVLVEDEDAVEDQS